MAALVTGWRLGTVNPAPGRSRRRKGSLLTPYTALGWLIPCLWRNASPKPPDRLWELCPEPARAGKERTVHGWLHVESAGAVATGVCDSSAGVGISAACHPLNNVRVRGWCSPF